MHFQKIQDYKVFEKNGKKSDSNYFLLRFFCVFNFFSISLNHTLLRMRSQIGESIEELHRKIDVATHSKQSVIKGYYVNKKIRDQT